MLSSLPTPDFSMLEDFNPEFFLSGGFETFIIITVFWIIRTVAIRFIRAKHVILSDERRRWITRIKNIFVIAVFFALILIWAPQLRTFALSLTAIAVAMVIATKELILCLSGSLFRVSTQPFKVGDWVIINNIAGEVIDLHTLGFEMQEIEKENRSYNYTGKIVFIPYSWLLSHSVDNLGFLKSYVFKDISVTVQYADLNPEHLIEKLQSIANDIFKNFEEDALKFLNRTKRKTGFDIGEPKPEVFIRTTDLGHMVFTVRLFLPTKRASQLAAKISREFLSYVYDMKKLNEEKADKKSQKPSLAKKAKKTKKA